MTQSARFWDKLAEKYERQPVSDEESYQKKLEITRRYLEPEMDVLEFGCGTGSTAIAHAPYVKHIRAIDISTNMIDIARSKAEAGGVTNVDFSRADLEGLSAPEQSLDVVLALSVLHLLENRDEAISRVHKMLKPGGVFITSTACLGDKLKVFKLIAPIGKLLGLLPLVKIFTTKELVDSLTTVGFDIEYQWKPDKGMAVFIVARKI
jgi:ubiquinone/menaquinone biosynthesis C-methylase UbiE